MAAGTSAPAGSLPGILATRSAEIIDAVDDAVVGLVAHSSDWLAQEHTHAQALRMRLMERALSLSVKGEPFTDDDLLSFREMGRLLARRAVPLSFLTEAFDVGMAAATREFWRIAPAGLYAETVQFTQWAAGMMEQGRQAATRGYLEASLAGSGRRPALRALAEALISGESALSAAEAAGERLAVSYLVLACAVPAPATVDAPRLAAFRRDLEAVPGALYCGDLSGLVVLLPAGASPQGARGKAADLVGRLGSLTGQAVCAAQAYRPDLAGIPAAYQEACHALGLARAIPDAAPRPYRSDELLVELAIARQPDIGQRLAALLAPLDGGPDLRRTVEALLACNLDRERAARELRIHRRTLRYRMVRIREVSGIDLDTAHGVQLFRAALTAARLLDPGKHLSPRSGDAGTQSEQNRVR
jgi:hypothetical protein